jgi:hypothetical protein
MLKDEERSGKHGAPRRRRQRTGALPSLRLSALHQKSTLAQRSSVNVRVVLHLGKGRHTPLLTCRGRRSLPSQMRPSGPAASPLSHSTVVTRIGNLRPSAVETALTASIIRCSPDRPDVTTRIVGNPSKSRAVSSARRQPAAAPPSRGAESQCPSALRFEINRLD